MLDIDNKEKEENANNNAVVDGNKAEENRSNLMNAGRTEIKEQNDNDEIDEMDVLTGNSNNKVSNEVNNLTSSITNTAKTVKNVITDLIDNKKTVSKDGNELQKNSADNEGYNKKVNYVNEENLNVSSSTVFSEQNTEEQKDNLNDYEKQVEQIVQDRIMRDRYILMRKSKLQLEEKLDDLDKKCSQELDDDKEYQQNKNDCRKISAGLVVLCGIAVVFPATLTFIAPVVGIMIAVISKKYSDCTKKVKKVKKNFDRQKELLRLEQEYHDAHNPELQRLNIEFIKRYKPKRIINEAKQLQDVKNSAKDAVQTIDNGIKNAKKTQTKSKQNVKTNDKEVEKKVEKQKRNIVEKNNNKKENNISNVSKNDEKVNDLSNNNEKNNVVKNEKENIVKNIAEVVDKNSAKILTDKEKRNNKVEEKIDNNVKTSVINDGKIATKVIANEQKKEGNKEKNIRVKPEINVNKLEEKNNSSNKGLFNNVASKLLKNAFKQNKVTTEQINEVAEKQHVENKNTDKIKIENKMIKIFNIKNQQENTKINAGNINVSETKKQQQSILH